MSTAEILEVSAIAIFLAALGIWRSPKLLFSVGAYLTAQAEARAMAKKRYAEIRAAALRRLEPRPARKQKLLPIRKGTHA